MSLVSSSPLHIERREGYSLVVDPAAPSWLATNEDGAWLLRQLRTGASREAGQVSQSARDEVSYRYARRVGVSLARALELVGRFADEAGDFISPPSRTPYRGRASYLEVDRLKEVWLHITDQCNLACRHCLVSSGPRREDGLPTDLLRGYLRQAVELGADTFYFTGGEPLLRRDLPEVLGAVTADYGGTAVVLTNGTLLDEELAERLARLPRERLFLQVSLDGSTAARNDALRSPGSFEGAVRGIGNAVRAGLNVTAATVVLKRNLDDLVPLARLVRGLGVKQVHLMWQHTRERGRRFRRASLRDLQSAVPELLAEAAGLGLMVDNVENVRRVVNGEANVKYDLSNACWDSVAIYRDGRVFPSACLVGIESESGGSLREERLKDIWLGSERFAACRARSVVDLPGAERDPLVFLHGGGDPEQAFFAAAGNGQAPRDPYLPLHRMLAKAAMDEIVAHRRALIGSPPPGPMVYHFMGEDGLGCPSEAGVRNGGEHAVDFVHSNCVLIQDVIARARAQIRQYYGEAAREVKSDICSPLAVDPRYLAHIPDEVVARSYGCGSPVLQAGLAPGETVADLGSGAGLECFIAARLLGAAGRAIGVDMTEEMVAFAESMRPGVAARLGYDNVRFRRGLLEAIPLADAEADAVISNCVVNLSPEKLRVLAEIRRVLKPGGRVVISDIVSERPLPPKMRFNPRLRGECIAGALTEAKLLRLLDKLGFEGVAVIARAPWRTVEGISFDTVTVRAWKPAAAGQARPAGSALLSTATPPPLARITRASSSRHIRDCLVCGAPLEYLTEEQWLTCHYCGQSAAATARCQAGHFVCDQCHTGDHLEFIRSFCARTAETDPVALFFAMRRSSLFPMHGPEHHALVPAAFLTAYRNRFGEPLEGRVAAAIERAARMPGGTCAYWGACAAGLGIGVAYAAILGATPLTGGARGSVQTVVSRLLSEIGRFAVPRCCRRESYLALRLGCELSGEHLPHALNAGPPPACDQTDLNRECLGPDCLLHPDHA
jgi:MoaA/NifB/PqqE/SkfB family radical SAM enzyme/SAM-dependent methyltransferase